MQHGLGAVLMALLLCVTAAESSAQSEVVYEPCGWTQPFEWVCAKGVHGLAINGRTYDVDFVFGQFTYWFPDPYSNGIWGNRNLAEAAANATLAALIDSGAEQIAGPNELGYIGYPHGGVSFQFEGMGPAGPLVPSDTQLAYQMYFQKHTGTPETGVFFGSSWHQTMHAKLTEKPTEPAPRYTVIDLGTLGGEFSESYGINNAGQVVGTSGTAVPTEGHAFLNTAGLMKDLGTLGGEDSLAYSIDAFGRVTGYSYLTDDNIGRAFIYENGTMRSLPTLGGLVNQGNSINDSGHVAGWSETTGRTAYRAFYFDGNRMRDLGTLGGTRSEGYAINESGMVVGRSYTTSDGALHAFIFDGSDMRDLGTLGGTESAAYGINDAGHVVGTSQTSGDATFRAFIYDGFELRQIGNLHNSVAYSINASGHAVGDYTAPNSEVHGFIFDGVAAYDLNSLIDPASGWTIREARAINDLGQVAGLGCNAAYQCRAVRLDPVRTGVWLAGLTLKQPVVAGCKSVAGTVKLSGPAPAGGLVVSLRDSLASANAPATVLIPAGATTKGFTVKTSPVVAPQMGVVTAELGDIKINHGLTVRPIGLSSLQLSPATVVGGQNAAGTATLECAAGPGPVTVDLSTSNAAVAAPVAPTVVVPQGLKSETFTVATNPVFSKASAMITGEASTTTKARRLNVVPAAVASPTRLGFGIVSVGQISGALGAILRNDGVAPFAVSSISLTGTYASWFAQTNNCPASLAAGASCTISVTFTPLAAASKSAKLTIATSATSTPLSVSLSGTGI